MNVRLILTEAQASEVWLACDARLTELWEQDGGEGTPECPYQPSRATRRDIDVLQRAVDRLQQARRHAIRPRP